MNAKAPHLPLLHLQSGAQEWTSPVLLSLALHGSLIVGGVALWLSLSEAPRARTEPVEILLLERVAVETEAAPSTADEEPPQIAAKAVLGGRVPAAPDPVAVTRQAPAPNERPMQARTIERRRLVDERIVIRPRSVREPLMLDRPASLQRQIARGEPIRRNLEAELQEAAKLIQPASEPVRSAEVARPLIEGPAGEGPSGGGAERVMPRSVALRRVPAPPVQSVQPGFSEVHEDQIVSEVGAHPPRSSRNAQAVREPMGPARSPSVPEDEVARLPAFTPGSRLNGTDVHRPLPDENSRRSAPGQGAVTTGATGLAPRPDYGWVAQALWDRIGQLKRYPYVARMNRWEGTVVVHGVVKANGELDRLRLEASSGHHVLDEDALDLLRKVSPLVLPRDLGRSELPLRVPITYKLH